MIWIDPDFSYSLVSYEDDDQSLPHMRWVEWHDVTRIVASSKMVDHHLPTGYLGALELRLGEALGLADPADAMSELTRSMYET